MKNERRIEQVLKEFKEKLRDVYGDRLKKVILYGSWARNQAKESSDIDISVVLKGKVIAGEEIDKMIDIISELNLKYNVLISVYPVSEDVFTNVNSPLLLNIRKEGIVV